MKAKTITAYCIINRHGNFMPDTTGSTKGACLCKANSLIPYFTWQESYKHGYRCVKVQIIEVKPK